MKRLLVIAPVLLIAACGSLVGNSSPDRSPEQACADQPIETYRRDLLELAFCGVSMMPIEPHIKNRSRAQLKVFEAALELNQAALADDYVGQVENWRRWMGYADLAVYFAENGSEERSRFYDQKVERALVAARELHSGRVVAATANPLLDPMEDWRYESVLSRVTEARRINQSQKDLFNASTETYGELNAVKLNISSFVEQEEDFSKKMATLRQVAEAQDIQVIAYALSQMADVAAEHYGEADLIGIVGNDVAPRLVKVPPVSPDQCISQIC